MSKSPGRLLPIFLTFFSFIVPGAGAPSVSSTLPAPSSGVGALTSVSITFSEAVSGVEAADLMVNGEPAVSLTGSGAGPYAFGFTQPPPGTVSVEWTDDPGISGLGTGAFNPAGAWSYTLVDNVAPAIDLVETSVPGQSTKHVLPAPSSVVSTMTQTTVHFSEPVTGVNASDLRINGQAATAVTGSEAGPYVFSFAQPGNGAVNFTWQAAPGITDGNGNLFVAESWSVAKSSSVGSVVISEFLAANGGAASIPANGMLALWADPASAASTNPSAHLNSGIGIDSEFEHDYSAWGLELVNPLGQIADRIPWGIQVSDQSIGRDGTDTWKLLDVPTRGETNASPEVLGALAGVRINEWTGLDVALGGISTGQFSELHNASGAAVDLSGLWLGDAPSESGIRRWRFPALSFVGAGSHALLLPSSGGNDPARPNFSLNRGGEMLILSDDSNTLDSVGFGLSDGTGSEGRAPDGSVVIATLLPTPGAANVPANSPLPVFYQHPRSRSVAAGGSLTLSAAAQPASGYQWYFNGDPVPDAISPDLVLNPLTAEHEGNWQCLASNGGDTVFSQTALITVYYNYEMMAAEKSLGPADGDDDGDGTPNAIEFLTGTDPLTPDHSPSSTGIESEGENLYLLHSLRISGRAAYSGLTGELSPDFQAWLRSEPVEDNVLSTEPNGDRTMQFKFLMPPNEPRQFLRMVLDP